MSKRLFLTSLLCVIVAFIQAQPSFSVYYLSCEQLSNPVGIDNPQPSFGWQINATGHDFVQQGYRILVASSAETLAGGKGDMWDSGNVDTDQSVHLIYNGKPLASATTYYWKVEVAHNDERRWSNVATFTTALLKSSDWSNSRWIAMEREDTLKRIIPHLHTPDARKQLKDKKVGNYRLPQFRKTFTAKKQVARALAFVSGLGQFELYVNGTKAGNHFLDPGWSKYDKEALYVTFDVTRMLNRGDNVLGVMIGNGFYNIPNERYFKMAGSFGVPKLRLLLRITYSDGSESTIVTDKTWRVAESPLTYSSIFGGEDYDATKELNGWMTAGYSDKRWTKAVEVDCKAALKAQTDYPITVRDSLPVVSKSINKKGKWLYDFGQNLSGIVRLHIKGERGKQIVLRPAELLNPDGTVNQSATGSPYCFTYTLRGDSAGETWQPQFSYYGFRYVQVEGAVPMGVDNPNALPQMERMTALHTCNSAPEAGTFACSKPLYNKIYTLIDWAMCSNMASVLTDCPHREKLGWLEQVHLMQYSLQYRYDLQRLYYKIMADMAASQTPNGMIPTIAPEYVRFADGFEDTPEWGSAFIISPWYIYKFYGDRQLIDTYYPQMKRYHHYLSTRATDNIVAYGLGDWFDIGPKRPGYAQLTSNGLTSTAIYYYDTSLLARMAELKGLTDEAAHYTKLAEEIKQSFNRHFYNPDTKTYDRNSQTTNAIILYMGLAPDSIRKQVVNNLKSDITNRNNALTAGDVGYRYLLRSLEQNGLSELIYDMNNRYDVPGYGWQLAHGATALTESWQAYGFVSNNHFMLGHLMEWFFSGLGGIGQTEASRGFKTVEINPQTVGDVRNATTSYNSPYGTIRCNWQRSDNGDYTLKADIPANSEAIICLPTATLANVTDYGVAIEGNRLYTPLNQIGGMWRIKVGSGNYMFTVKNN